MRKSKIPKVIFIIMLLVSIACSNVRNTKEHEKIFSKILNVEQILTSDTIKIIDEFSTIPQEIFKTVSFTILDSALIANNKTYYPFKYKNDICYISFINDTLFFSDLKKEQAVLILNAKNGTLWEVNENTFIPESQISIIESFWNNEIQDTVFVFSVKEKTSHVSDTPSLKQIYFSKTYGFIKFVYSIEFLNNKTLECYDRNNKIR